ncbi:MAG: histidine phosphatase family protein [Deltaproteobacteria bacterium]|nr:histidine phosphatase family protein [Deltaproteobacteria bacterium]
MLGSARTVGVERRRCLARSGGLPAQRDWADAGGRARPGTRRRTLRPGAELRFEPGRGHRQGLGRRGRARPGLARNPRGRLGGPQTFAIGGGESWPEVFQRADASLAALRSRMPDGGRAIVFTHGGIIAALLSGLLGVRDQFPWPLGRMRNTGRTTLRFSENQVELVSHNDDTHIPSDLRQKYEPRPDQVLVRMTSITGDSESGGTGTADFNSAIKSARKTSAGGAVSVSGTSQQIALVAQQTAGASVNEFRFVEPAQGRSTELLISESHQMLLDYGLPMMQI